MSVIQTENLCKSYGARRGVSDINLSVSEGEIFGFIGPNGAGKSTTIRLLLGFLKSSTGSARIFDLDCWNQSASIKRDIGYVAGDVRLYSWLTTRLALKLVGEIRGNDLTTSGMELVDRFAVEPDLPVRKMSRGNRQKMALVLSLVHQPKLIILDEPTSGLDPLMQDTLADCLRELAAKGHTVFFSSHTLSEVESLCDRVAIVRDGIIVADEKLSDLKDRAPRSVVLTFASDEAANSVTVPDSIVVEKREGERLHLQLQGEAAEVSRWAAAQPITDLSIGRPNLESLFREYYQTESSAADGVTEAESQGSPQLSSVSSPEVS